MVMAELAFAARGAVRGAAMSPCGRGHVSCRFTHVYPDGPAPYFTFVMPAPRGGDCATAEDLVTDAYLREEGDCDTSMIPTELEDQVTYDVGTAKVDDAAGTATVPVEVAVSGQKETASVGLVKENGKWRVNEVG